MHLPKKERELRNGNLFAIHSFLDEWPGDEAVGTLEQACIWRWRRLGLRSSRIYEFTNLRIEEFCDHLGG